MNQNRWMARYILKPLSIIAILLVSILIPISAFSIQTSNLKGTLTPQPHLLALGEKLHAIPATGGEPDSGYPTPSKFPSAATGTSFPSASPSPTVNPAKILTSTTHAGATPTLIKTAPPLPTATIASGPTSYPGPGPTSYPVLTPTGVPTPSSVPAPSLTPTRTRTPVSTSQATNTPVAYQGTLCGNLTQDVRLAASHGPYEVTCNTTITVGTTLSAGPGTIVKIYSGIKLIVDGTLTTSGTAANPVIFTSFKNDSAGGDTNHDGSASQAAAGDWEGIQVNTPGTANLVYSTVEYAVTGVSTDSGKADISYSTISSCNEAGLSCTNCQMSLVYNTIKNNLTGVFASNASLWMDTNQVISNSGDGISLEYPMQGDPTIAHNTLTGNDYPISLLLTSGSLNLPISGISNNTVSGNQINGLGFSGLLMGDSTIKPTDGITYVNLGLTVWSGVTLTIKANTVIKSVQKAGIEVNGTLIVQGSASQPVVFTSIVDDGISGDTNGDGATTQPGPNDWDGISAMTGSKVTIDYSILRFGESPVVIDNGEGTVTHSSLSYSTRGVTVLGGTFTMSGCILSGNDIGIYTSLIPTLSISGNDISGNKTYGFFNSNLLATVPAKNNWWGSADGPKPYGNGNSINFSSHTENGQVKVDQIFVDVTPWLASAP